MGAAKRKNLMLIVPMLHQGGFERVCVRTARELKDEYEVSILIFDDRDMHYDVTGLNVININAPVVKGKAAKALNVLKRARLVRKVKREKNTDIAYSFGESANLVNVLSKASERTITGIRCSTDLESPRLVGLFARLSDTVIACSEDILRTLKKDFKCRRVRRLYNPLDVKEIRQQAGEGAPDDPVMKRLEKIREEDPEAKIVSAMGRDDIIKGFWHLIKAFSLCCTQTDAYLLILGAGRFTRARKLAKELGISDRVIFAGNKKNPFPFLAATDLYVLSSNHEGFPNALLEAMALSLPVIATDCRTGPGEILAPEGGYGVLIPDMDGREDYDAGNITGEDKRLAAEIQRLLTDDGLRKEYGEKAAERAADFSPERYRRELCKILNEGVKKR